MYPGGMGDQFGNTRAVRELASAANQGGHLRTLSETYGGGGWEMDFSKGPKKNNKVKTIRTGTSIMNHPNLLFKVGPHVSVVCLP